ncbi:MAG: leucyl aminopeptidase family protein [Pseudomonadota bacterium]
MDQELFALEKQLAEIDQALPKLSFAPSAEALRGVQHTLCILPNSESLDDALPGRELLLATLARRAESLVDLEKSPLLINSPEGGLFVCLVVPPEHSSFMRDSLLCKALALLLSEHPATLHIVLHGALCPSDSQSLVEAAVYSAWVNGQALPRQCAKPVQNLQHIYLSRPGADVAQEEQHQQARFAALAARAAGNLLARRLTALPANVLTPASYRACIEKMAQTEGWAVETFDLHKLEQLGAGAFLAVAQGSASRLDRRDPTAPHAAAIVHLRYTPPTPNSTEKAASAAAQQIQSTQHSQSTRTTRVALVGKGICFDTGGHNLKPAKYMAGMHEDMNGSAVALGLLLAVSRQKLPVQLDVWLAIAENHLSPQAYQQGDIVRALNGTSIEIAHTDAEGRMVLADTLTLAQQHAGEGLDLIIDFATLTGSMVYALGNRYAGVFASEATLGQAAVAAGQASGERVCLFPQDEDYEAELESQIADIKQCTLDGEADHILATRFLKRFVGATPWLHLDLSASNCKGGLGAIASDLTGFGVAWGLELLRRRLAVPSD